MNSIRNSTPIHSEAKRTHLADICILLFLLLDLQTLCIFGVNDLAIGGCHRPVNQVAAHRIVVAADAAAAIE